MLPFGPRIKIVESAHCLALFAFVEFPLSPRSDTGVFEFPFLDQKSNEFHLWILEKIKIKFMKIYKAQVRILGYELRLLMVCI